MVRLLTHLVSEQVDVSAQMQEQEQERVAEPVRMQEQVWEWE